MSTELRPVTQKISQTRFWGGKERGVCLQVTQTSQECTSTNPVGVGFVQLTREEAAVLAGELMRFATGTEVEMA